MSLSKERHPGAIYHIARRCHRREFRLRPDQDLMGAIAVLIQDACERTGVRVIAIVWMSDHYHAILYDPFGRISEWFAHVHGTLARYCNAVHGVGSHMWDSQEAKDQELGDIETVADKVAYVIANPVEAGLVYGPSGWPGICTTLNEVASRGGPVHRRPKRFFRQDGPVSEVGQIVHACPPGISPQDFRRLVGKYLAPKLAEARAQVARSGRGFLGATKVLAASPFDTAKSPESRDTGLDVKPFRKMLAATPEKVRAMVARRQDFLKTYAIARRKLMRGVPSTAVTFPAGTWKQWRYMGARREPPLQLRAAA